MGGSGLRPRKFFLANHFGRENFAADWLAFSHSDEPVHHFVDAQVKLYIFTRIFLIVGAPRCIRIPAVLDRFLDTAFDIRLDFVRGCLDIFDADEFSQDEQLFQATKGQTAVQQDLNRLLELLVSGDRKKANSPAYSAPTVRAKPPCSR